MAEEIDHTPSTIEEFRELVGETFTATAEEIPMPVTPLTLVKAHATGNPRPFSLFFEGSADVELPQQIYWLENSRVKDLGIFIVPISQDANVRTYQAVFA